MNLTHPCPQTAQRSWHALLQGYWHNKWHTHAAPHWTTRVLHPAHSTAGNAGSTYEKRRQHCPTKCNVQTAYSSKRAASQQQWQQVILWQGSGYVPHNKGRDIPHKQQGCTHLLQPPGHVVTATCSNSSSSSSSRKGTGTIQGLPCCQSSIGWHSSTTGVE